jgi:hypothetical protein
LCQTPPELGRELAVIGHRDGRHMLVCVDFHGGVHRWDPFTGTPLGPAIAIPERAHLLVADVDRDGTLVAFIYIGDGHTGNDRVERWRLDTGEMTGQMPDIFCTLHHHNTSTMMIVAEADGSITIAPA